MTKKAYIRSQRLRPIGKEGIEQCRRILLKEGAAKINEVFVDSFSASVILAIYDKLSGKNKAKLESMPVARACDICYTLYGKHA